MSVQQWATGDFHWAILTSCVSWFDFRSGWICSHTFFWWLSSSSASPAAKKPVWCIKRTHHDPLVMVVHATDSNLIVPGKLWKITIPWCRQARRSKDFSLVWWAGTSTSPATPLFPPWLALGYRYTCIMYMYVDTGPRKRISQDGPAAHAGGAGGLELGVRDSARPAGDFSSCCCFSPFFFFYVSGRENTALHWIKTRITLM